MSTTAPPRSSQGGSSRWILLATDLSCRCDRAQDRAALLAEQWGARLAVLHVLEAEPSDVPSWRGPSAAARIAERRIRADIADRRVEWEVILDHGEPAAAILRQAVERGCDLIVTGIARDRMLAPAILGTTVDWLVRRTPVPVLVVKCRPHRPYAELVVATDFSEPSRHALESALRLFPEAHFTLFHAFRVPFEGLIDRDVHRDEFRATATAECADFLSRVQAPPAAFARMTSVIEFGSPAELLCAYIQDRPVDLVVLGTQGRSGLPGFLLGSTAELLLTLLPCDVMMVRGPTPLPAAAAGGD